MYDNENRDFCSMSLVSFHVFPYGNKPSISVHTKKKNKTKIGSLRYRLKKWNKKSNKNVHLEAIVKMSGNLAESQFLPSGETHEQNVSITTGLKPFDNIRKAHLYVKLVIK